MEECFDGMGETEVMESGVGVDDFVVDPGFAVVIGTWGSTGADGLVERSVGADGEEVLADESAQGTREVELVKWDDCAGVGLIPVDGTVCGIGHGEVPMPIGV